MIRIRLDRLQKKNSWDATIQKYKYERTMNTILKPPGIK